MVEVKKEEKEQKPKNMAKVTITLLDDGRLLRKYYIWKENEIGAMEPWTVEGTTFFKHIASTHLKKVNTITSCFNIQIALAKLPDELQSFPITDETEKTNILKGYDSNSVKTEIKESNKPKKTAQVTLTLLDNGLLLGDYFVWEENEAGRKKKWTVPGRDFFRNIAVLQRDHIKTLATALNTQVIIARLPDECQSVPVVGSIKQSLLSKYDITPDEDLPKIEAEA